MIWPQRGQLRRRIVYGAFAAALVWLVIDGAMQVRAFFGENRSVEFYRERPHLLWVCAATAVAVGLCVKLAAVCLGRRRNDEQ